MLPRFAGDSDNVIENLFVQLPMMGAEIRDNGYPMMTTSHYGQFSFHQKFHWTPYGILVLIYIFKIYPLVQLNEFWVELCRFLDESLNIGSQF